LSVKKYLPELLADFSSGVLLTLALAILTVWLNRLKTFFRKMADFKKNMA
jgi:hypothetical protein